MRLQRIEICRRFDLLCDLLKLFQSLNRAGLSHLISPSRKQSMTKYYVDADGKYLGGFDGILIPQAPDEDGNEMPPVWQEPEPPAGAVEVPVPPEDARQIWQSGSWSAPIVPPPDSVSARQFKLQLLATDLLDEVEAWIAGQGRAVQIAYENSGSFVRQSPMMQTGFAALGFTSEQINAFFVAASKL